MSRIKYSKSKSRLMDEEFQPPKKKIETEGDLLVKKLHKKQTNIETTLEKELSRNINFERKVEIFPISLYGEGSKTVEEIKNIERKAAELEKLQSFGVQDEDASIYLNYMENGVHAVKTKHKLLSVDQILAKVELIETLLKKANTKNASPSTEISRHDKDYLTLKPNSKETKLFKFAIENEASKKNQQCPHPMDQIGQVAEEFMENVNDFTRPVKIKNIRRKARHLTRQIEALDELQKKLPEKIYDSSASLAHSSKWDKKELENSSSATHKNYKIYTCKREKPKKLYRIQNGLIVELGSDVPLQKQRENEEIREKLSIDEIKKLPKFENYEPGIPSKTLYVKNLSKSVTNNDLETVFSSFKDNLMAIKVMQGRMRGQAFIELKDEEIAGKALHETIGTFLKNKPIVIQYGKALEPA